MVAITGDVVLAGDLTANNFIVGSTNLVTEINTKQDLILDGGLTITKTNGLQTALDATAKLASFNSFTANQSITGDLFVSGGAISNTATVLSTTPTLDGQLTSKLYVDSQVDLKQNLILDGGLNITKTNGLQTALDGKQDKITTSTDLNINSLITSNLEVNGGVRIDNKSYFETIVIRRFNEADYNIINLNQLQVWVNGSNILFPNSTFLTGYFANWADKQTDRGSYEGKSPVSNIYNNVIEADFGTHSLSGANALIIKNIPLTSINEIQAIVLYNRKTSSNRIIGLFFELYNSTNDPDFTEVLANTNVISQSGLTYRYNFPSLSTYTGSFATADSTTNIVSNSIASTEEANFTPLFTALTGDLVVAGDMTSKGVIINTTLTDILSRLTALETP